MGKIALAEATLVEDPSESNNDDEDGSVCSGSTRGSTLSVIDSVIAGNRDFKIIIEPKGSSRTTFSIHLVAPTAQDKEAWISDISQCLDNIHMHSLLSPGIGGSSGGKIPPNECLLNVSVFCFMFVPKFIHFKVLLLQLIML